MSQCKNCGGVTFHGNRSGFCSLICYNIHTYGDWTERYEGTDKEQSEQSDA